MARASILPPVHAGVADEMFAAAGEVPAYAAADRGPPWAWVRASVEEAPRHFIAEIEAGGRVPRIEVYRALGRGELHAGPPQRADERQRLSLE